MPGHCRLFLLLLGLALLLIATGHAAGGQHDPGAAAAGAITYQQGVDRASAGSMNMMRSMVGSRPPSCAGMCWWCGGGRRCEAVQVPITPQEQEQNRRHGHGHGHASGTSTGASSSSSSSHDHQQLRGASSSTTTSSYDDHSNYKPLSWRCKCGGG